MTGRTGIRHSHLLTGTLVSIGILFWRVVGSCRWTLPDILTTYSGSRHWESREYDSPCCLPEAGPPDPTHH